jgi:hypothetical protein
MDPIHIMVTTTPYSSVHSLYFFLGLPESPYQCNDALSLSSHHTFVTRKNSEAALRLLKKDDGLNVMHRMCVCETQAAFYRYDHERQIVLLKGKCNLTSIQWRVVHWDHSLRGGVMQMCREFTPDFSFFPSCPFFRAAVNNERLL